MRFDGILIKWDDERGFGFIAPRLGGQEIFIHISSFPRDGRRPGLNEALSFEIELNSEGKKRAVNVQRPARACICSFCPYATEGACAARGLFNTAVAVVLMVSLGVYAFSQISRRAVPPPEPAEESASPVAAAQARPQPLLDAKCDGRTHCSQMTSCAEATFFSEKLSGRSDGRQPRRRPLRTAVVHQPIRKLSLGCQNMNRHFVQNLYASRNA